MKRIFVLLMLLLAGWGVSPAAPAPTNSAPADRILVIDPSSMPVAAGKATLIIGALQHTNGVFAGDYRLKVHPYFWKNEKGRLAIVISDADLADAARGKVVTISGIATTSGQNGRSRPIKAIATPVDMDHGTLRLWFTAGSRKMIFEPAYHFAGKGTTLVLAQTTQP